MIIKTSSTVAEKLKQVVSYDYYNKTYEDSGSPGLVDPRRIPGNKVIGTHTFKMRRIDNKFHEAILIETFQKERKKYVALIDEYGNFYFKHTDDDITKDYGALSAITQLVDIAANQGLKITDNDIFMAITKLAENELAEEEDIIEELVKQKAPKDKNVWDAVRLTVLARLEYFAANDFLAKTTTSYAIGNSEVSDD